MPAAGTYAEVAWAQLAALRGHSGSRARGAARRAEWFSREQLAVLLGVAGEAGLRVVGLVGAGLAAAALEPAPESLLHSSSPRTSR